jgi:hypothetical protein
MKGWITAAQYAERKRKAAADKAEAARKAALDLERHIKCTIGNEVNAFMERVEAGTAFVDFHGRSVARMVMHSLVTEELAAGAYARVIQGGRASAPSAEVSRRIAEGVSLVLSAEPLLYVVRVDSSGNARPGSSSASVVEVDEP